MKLIKMRGNSLKKTITANTLSHCYHLLKILSEITVGVLSRMVAKENKKKKDP